LPSDLEVALKAYGQDPSVSSQTHPKEPSPQTAKKAPNSDDSVIDVPRIPASVHSREVPDIDLVNRIIPANALERFPQDVARKYNMVVFALSQDGKEASVAAVNPSDPRVRDILKFVQQRNSVQIHLYKTSQASLTAALAQYGEQETAQTSPPLSSSSTRTSGIESTILATTEKLKQEAKTPAAAMPSGSSMPWKPRPALAANAMAARRDPT